jgi:hypothetical protein
MPIVQHLNKIKLEGLKPNALTISGQHYHVPLTLDNFTDQGKALALQFDTGKQINQVAP